MKLVNYDKQTLIMQNVKSAERPPMPEHFSKSQYRILRNLIIQKKIEKRFFDFIISGLFEKTDWKTLNYSEMFTLIHVLTFYDYEKDRKRHE